MVRKAVAKNNRINKNIVFVAHLKHIKPVMTSTKYWLLLKVGESRP